MGKCMIISGVNHHSYIIRQFFIGYLDRCCIGGEGWLITATHQIVPDNTGQGCNHDDEKQENEADTDQYFEKCVPHGPSSCDNGTPRAAAGCACCDLCNGFATFNASFYCCCCSLCRCFGTFCRCLCGRLFCCLFSRFGGLGGSLADIVLAISHLLFGRLCHSFTSNGVGK